MRPGNVITDMPEDNVPDKSDETLTPKDAYQLTEGQGLTQSAVAQMFGVSQPYVSRLVSQYQDARDEGRESVSPSDFPEDDLRSALGDEEPDENPYEHTCPLCDDMIPSPDSSGVHPCPSCGENIKWSEGEI